MRNFLLLSLPVIAILVLAGTRDAGSEPARAATTSGDASPLVFPQPDRVGSGAPSDALPAAEIENASRTIDRLIDAGLAKAGVKANPRTSDEQFVRRIYLDLIGRIPTFDEAMGFLNSKKASKRQDLIKQLIGSDGYISHQFNYWADLLRVETRLADRYPGQPYIDWLKQTLHDNKPYDKFVAELVQAEGSAIEKNNGGTGYYIRDAGMPQDNMANTVRLFLGTQITCAQCHDHPNDKWTRRDYFAMSAYTNGTSVDRKLQGAGMAMKKEMKGVEATPELKNALRTISYTLALKVESNGKSTMPLPHDYQYKDAKPGDPVKARAMFGETADVATKQDPRAVYAKWLTGAENPRFTLVIANRMWKKAMGLGLIEPVDHLTDETVASNPELMDFLTRLMIGVKYDLRKFQQILYESETYQRTVTKQDLAAGEAYYFPGPLLHRMSGEQVWDSMLTLTVPELDSLKGPNAETLYAYWEENKNKTGPEIFAMATEIAGHREKMKDLQKEFVDLRAQIEAATTEAQRAPLREKMKELADKRKELESNADPLRYAGKGGGAGGKGKMGGGPGVGALMRASELPQPAPAGHLLRTFGQSDRELIENATPSPAVTQALTLLNGFVDNNVLGKSSVLNATLDKAGDPQTKVRALYLSILCRQPTSEELAMIAKAAAGHGPTMVQDLAWCLLNSNEFLFVQ